MQPLSTVNCLLEPPPQESHWGEDQKSTTTSHRPISLYSTFVKVVKVALLAFLLFPAAMAQSWDCPTPQGSYLDSCDRPSGYPYRSTDPYLIGVQFCSYTISCKRANRPSERRRSHKVLPREDLACAKNWENCDGYLIGREGKTRFCTDNAGIKAQLREHGLVAEKDEL